MTHAINVRTRPTTAFSYRSNLVYESPLVLEIGGEYALPEPDAYARRLAEEAEAWLSHVRTRARMKEETVVRKALSALAFSFRHRTHDFAVPSKLSGVSKHQPVLWSVVRSNLALGTPLRIEEQSSGKSTRPRLAVSFDGDTLGQIQSKHVPWLRPLLPFGARLYLVRITGQDHDYTLGCNVAFGRVGSAVTALNHALGTDVGGDGYGASEVPTEAVSARTTSLPDHGGDGAEGGLRLVSSGLSVAKPQADMKAEDIVLYREIDGTPKATVEHNIRHSPTGIEWGYHGSGPADLARSILLAFTDESTANRMYQRFKAEVIASVPRAGGVIRSTDVRAWIAANGG